MGVWSETFNRKLAQGHDHGSAAHAADQAEARERRQNTGNHPDPLSDLQLEHALALEIIEALADGDPCQLDHNGNCQAHAAFGDGECPHALAKAWLERNRA